MVYKRPAVVPLVIAHCPCGIIIIIIIIMEWSGNAFTTRTCRPHTQPQPLPTPTQPQVGVLSRASHYGVAVPASHILLEPGCFPSCPASPCCKCPWESHGRVGWDLSTTAPAAAAFSTATVYAPAATAQVGGHGGLQWERAGGECWSRSEDGWVRGRVERDAT
jgi:hypothetical protein